MRQVRDLRTASAYLFGAICPERGEGAALVLPRADTKGMSLHLAEIGRTVAPGAHVILLADQAGWHATNRHRHINLMGWREAFAWGMVVG